MEIFYVIGWLVLCGAAAAYASNKGRSGAGIFFLSLFLSPLVGFVVAAVMKPHQQEVEEVIGDFTPDALSKKCPDCAEAIKLEALVCRFCGHKFHPEEVQATIQQAKSEFEEKKMSAAKDKLAKNFCPNCDAFNAWIIDKQKNSRKCEA